MSKKVFILGTGHWDLLEVPWEEKAEFWQLNNAYEDDAMNMDKVTRWFDLHTDERRRRRWQTKQIEWLEEEHDFPVYMQEASKRHPSAVEFPIDKIGKKLMKTKLQWGDSAVQRWFGCSHAFMTAFAIYEGFKEIEYRGIHLMNPVEVYMERPSFFYWLGQANARGIKTIIPESSYLLWDQTYAYDERVPEQWMPKSIAMYVYTIERFGDLLGVTDEKLEKQLLEFD